MVAAAVDSQLDHVVWVEGVCATSITLVLNALRSLSNCCPSLGDLLLQCYRWGPQAWHYDAVLRLKRRPSSNHVVPCWPSYARGTCSSCSRKLTMALLVVGGVVLNKKDGSWLSAPHHAFRLPSLALGSPAKKACFLCWRCQNFFQLDIFQDFHDHLIQIAVCML